MTDAEDAIETLKDALLEYGSSITLNTVTISAYNPVTDSITSSTISTNMNAIVKNSATLKTESSYKLQSPTSSYDYALMLYSAIEPEINDTVTISGKTFKVVFIDKMILQNIAIKYEALVKS